MADGQAGQDERLLGRLLGPIEGAGAPKRAAALLARFGSLPAVLAASGRLSGSDEGFAYLAVVQSVLRSAALGRLSGKPVVPTSGSAAAYLMLEMAHLPVEHLRVLFLDTRHRLIADETMARGTIDGAAAYPREIIKRALGWEAAALILAHNHPSGNPEPSRQDIAITRELTRGAGALGVVVLDHLILSSSGWLSCRANGLL